MRLVSFVAAAALAGSVACGYGTNPGSGCAPTDTRICMVNNAFTPAVDTVTVGATVQWSNGDSNVHTTTSSSVPAGAVAWDRTVTAGGQTSVTLTVAGTYAYYCSIHGSPGSGMHGTIVVQ